MKSSSKFGMRSLLVLIVTAGWLAGCVAPPAPPTGKIAPTQEVITVSAVEEAQKQVGFPILMPDWVPDGYALVSIRVITSPKQSIQIQYRKASSFLTRDLSVVEVWQPATQTPSLTPSKEAGTAKQVEVRGQPGILRAAFPGYRSVRWQEGNVQFIISGYESKETLLRIAESLSTNP